MKFSKLIIISFINIVTILGTIQIENIIQNKNIKISVGGKGDIFGSNFYNLISYGPASSVSFSAGESILSSRFKKLRAEMYAIIRNEIESQFDLITYELDENSALILNDSQFNLSLIANVKINSSFDKSKQYFDQEKIKKKIDNHIKTLFAISKNMIDANIESNILELQYFIEILDNNELNDYRSRIQDMKLTQQSLNFDRQRLQQMMDKNSLRSSYNLKNIFKLEIELKKNKHSLLAFMEIIFAYLILINGLLFIVFKYFKTKI